MVSKTPNYTFFKLLQKLDILTIVKKTRSFLVDNTLYKRIIPTNFVSASIRMLFSNLRFAASIYSHIMLTLIKIIIYLSRVARVAARASCLNSKSCSRTCLRAENESFKCQGMGLHKHLMKGKKPKRIMTNERHWAKTARF